MIHCANWPQGADDPEQVSAGCRRAPRMAMSLDNRSPSRNSGRSVLNPWVGGACSGRPRALLYRVQRADSAIVVPQAPASTTFGGCEQPGSLGGLVGDLPPGGSLGNACTDEIIKAFPALAARRKMPAIDVGSTRVCCIALDDKPFSNRLPTPLSR